MPPSRLAIVFSLFLVALCAASTVGCVLRGEWWWALAGVVVMAFAVWDLLGDLAERRYYRARPPS